MLEHGADGLGEPGAFRVVPAGLEGDEGAVQRREHAFGPLAAIGQFREGDGGRDVGGIGFKAFVEQGGGDIPVDEGPDGPAADHDGVAVGHGDVPRGGERGQGLLAACRVDAEQAVAHRDGERVAQGPGRAGDAGAVVVEADQAAGAEGEIAQRRKADR